MRNVVPTAARGLGKGHRSDHAVQSQVNGNAGVVFIVLFCLKKNPGWRELERALAAPAEDPDSIHSTHTVVRTHTVVPHPSLNSSSRRRYSLLPTSANVIHVWHACMQTRQSYA